MDLDQLRQLLDLVREHDLAEFEIEHDGLRLKVRKEAGGLRTTVDVVPTPASPVGPVAQKPDASAAAPSAHEGLDEQSELAVVKSPIVGTFYRSTEPGTVPFVEIGSSVKKGQVLCIIEAMKLMNEIDSEYDGEVVNVYVESGQPVQYGERMFAIRTK
jgi:acetyl-CoA carboxylase biotin carboxyl carrier protein